MFFHKAFGQSLIPGFDSMTIPLYIGDPIRIEGSYEDEQVRQEEYKRRLQRIPGINRKIHTFRDTKGPFQNPEIKKPSNLLLKGLFCSSLLSDSNQRPRDYKSRAAFRPWGGSAGAGRIGLTRAQKYKKTYC